MGKITGNVVGLPNPLSKVRAEIEKPREVIHLSNDMRIEAREDGIYLVTDNEENGYIESIIFEQFDGATYSDYSMEAEFAYYANSDEHGRTLKGIFVDEFTDGGSYEDMSEIEIGDGYVVSFGVINNPMQILLPPEDQYQYVGFTSAMYFATPSEIPENYTQFPDVIHFKGDSTDEGAFVPEANMRYTIVFDFDGYMLNGYVSGVTTV